MTLALWVFKGRKGFWDNSLGALALIFGGLPGFGGISWLMLPGPRSSLEFDCEEDRSGPVKGPRV